MEEADIIDGAAVVDNKNAIVADVIVTTSALQASWNKKTIR